MTYRALDSNGDYSLGHGMSSFATALAAVRQAIQTKLNMLQGEWWESLNDGFPLFQQILGDPGSLKELSVTDLAIKSRILEVGGVTGFSSFKSNFDHVSRHYVAVAEVNTEYGTVEVSIG